MIRAEEPLLSATRGGVMPPLLLYINAQSVRLKGLLKDDDQRNNRSCDGGFL